MITVHLMRVRNFWLAIAPGFTSEVYRGRSSTEAFGRILAAHAPELGIMIHAELDDNRRHVITHPPAAPWLLQEALSNVPEGKKRMAARIVKLLPPLRP